MRKFLRALRRGAALVCPRCPEPLFTGPFQMHQKCPGCGYLIEREQGYFIGAIYINYAITIIICLGGYFLTEIFIAPGPHGAAHHLGWALHPDSAILVSLLARHLAERGLFFQPEILTRR